MRKHTPFIAISLAATFLVPLSPAAAADEVNTAKLRKAVTVNGILGHERALQRIANLNGGTRASGTPGFDASAAYVKNRLEQAGYRVTEQSFTFPFYRELAPATLSQVSPTPTDYETGTFDYSGSGDVTGQIVPTNDVVIPATPAPSSTSGCEPTDFTPASTTTPQVALVQRGTCPFADKAANAQAAGYDAVVLMNEGNPGRTELFIGTLGGPFDIPVVGVSSADGAALVAAASAGVVTTRVVTSTDSRQAATKNILADSRQGDPEKVVVVGAHLDSVAAGAGINDNGSGTSAILEIAEEMATLGIKPRQQLRFAFWGAEEPGLLGSEHYVSQLSDVELGTIYANLNFDMLGSPNYVRFVYDGDGSASGEPQPGGPPGSAQIEQVFTQYFASQQLASAPTAFDGRSDYGPFIAAGIPAGGLFSGAEDVKTPEEAAVYGGTADEPYDACYHLACDTINNLSTRALAELGDAAAHATMTLARTKRGFFEDGSRRPAQLRTPPRALLYHGPQAVR